MRNRIYGKQLNRTSEHRRAMLRNLAAGLFEHGQIETTMPKAKAVLPFVEKIITTAKQGTLHARRQIEAKINDRHIHVWVSDENVPDSAKENDFFELPEASDIEFDRNSEVRKAPRLVQHIMATIAPMYADRDGGYCRIVRTGRHRLGDGGEIVMLQPVGQEDGPETGGDGTSSRRRKANRRAEFAAKVAPVPAAASAVAEPAAEEADAPEATEDA